VVPSVLGNAEDWPGEHAEQLKAELKALMR